jgi:nicotinamide mononucleotide transporter
MDLLNILGLVAFILTLISMYLVGGKSVWCWPVFIVSYLIQVFIFYETKQWFLILTMLALTIFSFINWYRWVKDNGNFRDC